MKYFILMTLSAMLSVGGTLLVQKHIVFLQELAAQFTGVVLVGGTRAGMTMSDHAAYVYAAMGGLLVLTIVKARAEAHRRWVNHQSKKDWEKSLKGTILELPKTDAPKNRRLKQVA